MRILPAAMIIHMLCFIDRSNIVRSPYARFSCQSSNHAQGNAKILNRENGDSLLQTLNISNQQYLVALMIFIVAFTIIQTPSNYMLKKYRPSRWMALMMLCWGAMTMLLGAVHNFSSLVAVRFFLGAFESGLFPGLVYVLTFWYRPEERAVRIAIIVASSSLGGAFGGAVAFAIGPLLRAALPRLPRDRALAFRRHARAREEASGRCRSVAWRGQDHVGGRARNTVRLEVVRALHRVHIKLGRVLEQLAVRANNRSGARVHRDRCPVVHGPTLRRCVLCHHNGCVGVRPVRDAFARDVLLSAYCWS